MGIWRHGGYELRKGIVQSCGCLAHDNRHKAHLRKSDPLHGAINRIFTSYKWGAIKRHIDFSLGFEEFRVLTSQNCFYCGLEPKQVTSSGRNHYFYNGIDRINSDLGYVNNNVVPCCKSCNHSKSYFSQEEFYQWAKKTYENLTKNKILGDNHEV